MKAKIFTFVRGLKNGTPPRFQSYLKSLTLLLVMVMSVNVWGADEVVATFESSNVVTNTTYQSYSNDDWSLSVGGNSKSCGFNSTASNAKKIGNSYGTLANKDYYGFVVLSKNKFSNIYKITFVCTGGSGNSGKAYLAYSTDNTNWVAISTKTGTGLTGQGATIGTANTTYTFEFNAISSASYYAFIVEKGNSTGNFRFDNVTATFYADDAPAYDITAQSNNTNYGTVALDGSTITATPKSGYRISATKPYEVTSGTAEVEQNDNTFTVTPSTNCTVQINFEEKGCTDHGGTNVTSGSSTSNSYGPIATYYNYSTRQILYTKTDLGLAAGKKGTIKSIYFEYASSTAMTKKTDVTIYMANTNLTALSKSAYVPYSKFTEVYSGSLNCAQGWNEISLATPFVYNGSGSLVVLIDDNSGAYESSREFKCHTANTTSGAQICTYSDSDDEDPSITDWSDYTETNNRPSTKFCIEEADMTTATVTWYVNNVSKYSQTDYPGTICMAPTYVPTVSDCDGSKVFVGWTTFQNYESENIAPSDLFTDPTTKTIPDGGANYYAVFADASSGGGSETKSYGFEDSDDETLWIVDGPAKESSHAHSGSKSGKITTNHTYVQFKNKVKVTSFSYWFKRSSTNSNYNVYIETSTTGENDDWTAVDTKAMSSFNNDSYASSAVTKTFDGETALYVRFHCYNTTATRYVDDISITYAGGTTYSGYITSCGEVGKTRISYNANTTAAYTGTLPDYVDQTNGQAYTISTNQLSRTGYTFVGWNTNADATEKMTTIPAADISGTPIILYAIWSANSYDIVFNGNGADGGTTMDNQSIKFDASADLNPNTYTRTGHTFQGWATTEGGQVVYADKASYTMNSTGAILYAVWKPNQHKITYVLGEGGSGCGNISAQDYGTTVTLCTSASKAYHTFAGWTSEDVTIVDNQFTMPDKDVTITATWTEFEKYTVTFKNNGEPIADLSRQVYAGDGIGKVLGVETALPTLASTDAKDWWSTTFVGWTVEDWDGKKAEYTGLVNANTLATDGMVLNAVWAKKGDASNKYQKITSTDELEDGNYILAGLYSSKYYAMKNATVSGGFYMDRVEVTPAQGIITTDNANIVWKLTFNTTNKTATFYNEALTSNNYLYAYSTGSGSNKYYDFGMRATAYYFNYSQDANTSGAWRFEASTLSGEYLTYYNNNTSKDYFNLYTQQSNPNYLFKQMPSLTDYITKSTTAPDLVVLPTALSNFSTIATAGPSIAQSFTLQGGNLKGDVTASVGENSDYEISASQESGYAKKITFTPNNKRVSATVYVRLANHTENTAIASASGTVTVATEDAVSQLVALSGKVDAKTLNSISIETAPKTTYTIGEKFNPAGLVITATYNSGDEEVAYAGNESEFTFNPTLETALTASDNKVTIILGGQSKDQLITMQCNVAWQVNGQPWTAGTPTTKVNVGSKIESMPTDPTSEACNGKTFVGWSASTFAKTDNPPTLLTKVADFTTLNAHTIYHAVFAKASEGGSGVKSKSWSFGNATDRNDWTASSTTDYFSTYYGFKNSSATIKKYDIEDFKNYAASATNITIGVTSFQHTTTGTDLTVILVDKNGNEIGTGKDITPATGTATSAATEQTVSFSATDGATGYKIKCKSFNKNALVSASRYEITYTEVAYSEYSTTCTSVYDVKFYTDKEKTQQHGTTQKVEEGSKATAPETEPSKAGATFAGWFTANDEALADKTITEATDFIAKWSYTAPTITGQPSGGEYSIGNVVTLLVVAEPIEGVTFTYQWQRLNGSTYEDIAGETNNYYTAPTNQESQNTYRCVVTNGDASTPSNGAQITVRPASYCAMPTIRIDELGEALAFIREATVTMECGNEGATIYYTTDGTDPQAVGANPETYTVPFKIDATKTIKAYATATDLESSSVQEKTFTKAELQSIEVKTAKTEYTALEPFDPSNLVITATYNYELSEEVAYVGHESEFTFDPALTTELGVDVEAVKIGWGGKEVDLDITVNCIEIAAPDVAESKQGSTGITLTWSAVENAASYQVKWNGVEAETPTYNIESSKYEFVKSGLTANTSYTYEVIAVGETNYCTSTTGAKTIKTKSKSCESITNPTIAKDPTDFYVGEEVLPTHFKVDKNYDNGEVVNDNPFSIALPEGIANPLTNDAIGTQTVELTFNNKHVSIDITVKPQPVVTWSVNGNGDNKQSFAYNATLVLPEDDPSAPQSCAEKTFVGWTTETYKDHDSDEAPEVLFTEAGDRKVTEDVTYYAVFAMVESSTITDDITLTTTGVSGSSYTAWKDKQVTTNAIYAGRCAGGNDAIQLRSDATKDKPASGLISTTSGGKVTKVAVEWNDNTAGGRVLNVFASNTAYTDVADLTDDSKKGTLLGTIVEGTSTELVVSGDYKYIGVRSNSGALYLDKVSIDWTNGSTTAYSTKCAARTPKSIEITAEATKTFDVNDPFTSEGLEIKATYDSGDPQVVTDYCTITAPDMTTAGEKDVNISYTENDVTVNTSYKINVRQPYYVMYESNGATTGTVPSDTKKYYTGEKVTVLANESLVKTDNVFKGWSYAGVTYQADEQVTVGTENITLTAVWEEKVPCTITLSENGNISTVTDKSTGDTYNLPTTITNNVDGYAFMGWSTQEIDDPVATTEPGTFFAKGEEITLTESAYTFYAVYARTSGTSSDYNAGKVTTDADIVAGGLYIFAIGDYAMNNTVESDAVQMTQNFAKTGLSSTDAIVFTLESATDGYYIKNNGGKYLLNGSKTNMSFSTYQTATTATAIWTFSYNTQKTSNAWQIQNTKNDDRFLGNPDASTHTVKAYATGNWDTYPHAITIYRLVGGYTTAPTIVVNGKTVMDVPANFHGNVIVEDVGDVTLNETTTWKNLTIKNGAKVKTNAALSIKDLLIETKMGAGTGKTNSPNMKGASGQLIIGDGGSVTASGSAIIENQIDPTGTATQGWYSFSVPFPVSAQNGIYFGETKLTNGVDYAIMEYLGDVRAQGQYGWKKYSGILQPGKMYVIAVTDSDFGKLRFKKTADGALVASNEWQAGIYGGGDDANWNAIGNPNLAIAQFVNNNGASTLQLYNHTTNTFTGYAKGELNIVVGSGFFIQAVEEHPNITMKVAEGDRGYRAPVEDIEEMPFVAIQLLQGEAMNDQVFLNADVNATLSYEIGRDVAKFFMQGEAKCAQIYVPAYGTNLCAAQFPLNAYDETMFPLTITAPKEGTYTIAAENVPENVDLFLEQNGALIWNLSTSAYEINLNKGETKDYSIRWNAHSSSTPTGNETINANTKAQKIFYQQNIYIIQENQMYNAQGIKVQ